MIYIERTIKVKKGEASIDEPVCLYKGDKNIEIRFLIENNPFKYKNDLTINYGQLIIKRENAPDIFSEPTKISGGRVIFVITGDMINELNELGNYTFQIRILNEDLTSRGTLPPVFAGITIKEPLCEEPAEPPKVIMNPDFYEIRTKGGTDFKGLFTYATIEQIPDFSTWDTSNVTTMEDMFYTCTNLTELDLSNFNTSNVTDMGGMFTNCFSLTTLDLSNFNTSNVTTMSYMFNGCDSLVSLNLSNFNVDKLDWDYKIFDLDDCTQLQELRLDNCSKISIKNIINLAAFPTNDIGITRKIYCKEANAAGLTPPTNWVFVFVDKETTSNPYTPGEFKGDSTITEVDTVITTDNTTTNEMFMDCTNLTTINGIDTWDTSNITNMSYMFSHCEALESLDLSGFNTNNVTNMDMMFYHCYNLKSIDMRNFNLTNVQSKGEYIPGYCMDMFTGCNNLRSIRLDNCDHDTIMKLITDSGLPSETITGVTKRIYVKQANITGLTAPDGWIFDYIS